jgi:ubiquinone biosynthesis protein COQ9
MQKKQALDDEIRESSGVDGKGMKLGTGAMVKRLTWERLMGNKEIIHRWQEVCCDSPLFLALCLGYDILHNSILVLTHVAKALALIAQPANVPISITELSLLADEIWFLANDTSVDSSWYTKRTSLSTIYAATELFMTTDKSVDFADTREFLERRFKDVQVLGGAVGDFGEWAGYTARAAVNVLRSKGVRI